MSEGIDVNKTNESNKCVIFHHWSFLDKEFKFQDVCSGCQDFLMMSTNLNDIAILNINGVDHYCIIRGISGA